MSERNVYVDGTWYGPDYPDNGQPPAGKVDGEFVGRKAAESPEDGDWVGAKAVTEREEAAQFGSPAPVEVTAERDGPPGEVQPVGIKAVQTQEEAAAFRGEPAKTSKAAAPDGSVKSSEQGDDAGSAKQSTKPAAVRRGGK